MRGNFNIFLVTLWLLILSCSSSPDKSYILIQSDQTTQLKYTSDEGVSYLSNLSLNSKYPETILNLKKFETEIQKPLLEKYKKRLDDISLHSKELGRDSPSIKRSLVAAVLLALVVPIPGAVETVLTVGIVVIIYKKVTEKEADVKRKEAIEDLIRLCDLAEDSLEEIQDDHLKSFVKKWEKEFQREEHLFTNPENLEDVRILDTILEKYENEKTWLLARADFELRTSYPLCSKGEIPAEYLPKSKPKKQVKMIKN